MKADKDLNLIFLNLNFDFLKNVSWRRPFQRLLEKQTSAGLSLQHVAQRMLVPACHQNEFVEGQFPVTGFKPCCLSCAKCYILHHYTIMSLREKRDFRFLAKFSKILAKRNFFWIPKLFLLLCFFFLDVYMKSIQSSSLIQKFIKNVFWDHTFG